MSTGLLVRDFVKEYRELRYSNSGSIALSEIEHNAYRQALTLEITHVDAPRYENLKTLPENTHYGYVTLFRGSTVTDTVPVKYPKFRVFDINNQGIWNYHQLTESVQVLSGVTVATGNESSNQIVSALGDSANDAICFLLRLNIAAGGDETVSNFLLEAFGCSEEGESSIEKSYRAFPLATPFPDIAKFKADIPCSFLWRLETWYLVNPAVYIADNPTDTGDETEGESEYPSPDQGDGDGDGSEFPPSDPPGAGRDPRDFTGGSLPPGAGVVFSVRLTADPGNCSPGIVFSEGPLGPFFGVGLPSAVEKGPPVPNCPAAGFGYRIRFDSGFRTTFYAQGAGIYSGEIVDLVIQ